MANICKGTLRIKGAPENIKKFLFNELQLPSDMNENGKIIKQDTPDSLIITSNSKMLYLKGSCRLFVSLNEYIETYALYISKNKKIVCLEICAAWSINSRNLLVYAIKYNLDMKIYAFEKGGRFNQDIEIINGKLTKDRIIKYDEYDWDCICPTIGG